MSTKFNAEYCQKHYPIVYKDIPPPLGQALLARRDPDWQRGLNDKHVIKLACEMRAGRWEFNPTCIVVIDEDGKVINGQHTLHSGVMSGCTITVGFVVGVPRNTIHVIDVLRPRSPSDSLHVVGVKNSGKVSSYIRACLCTYLKEHSASATNTAALKLHDLLGESTTALLPYRTSTRNLGGAYIIGGLVFPHMVEPVKVEEFANQLLQGIMVPAKSPASLLRKWFESKGHSNTFAKGDKKQDKQEGGSRDSSWAGGANVGYRSSQATAFFCKLHCDGVTDATKHRKFLSNVTSDGGDYWLSRQSDETLRTLKRILKPDMPGLTQTRPEDIRNAEKLAREIVEETIAARAA